MKTYVIGSLSNILDITRLAHILSGHGDLVKSVKLENNKSFAECVAKCFDNIEWCDRVVVVTKPNGLLGNGTTYEIEYAKRLNKPVIISTNKEVHNVQSNCRK